MLRMLPALFAAVALAGAACGESPPSLEVGAPLPILELTDLDGTARSTADLLGTKSVLIVFASW